MLSVAAERLCLTVNLDKSKVIVFRKGGVLAAKEKWFLGGAVLEVMNKYKYLGLTFSAGHSFRCGNKSKEKHDRSIDSAEKDQL